MASVTASEIPHMKDFMKDFWEFMKSYWTVENTQEYLYGMLDAASALSVKYRNDASDALIMAFVNYQSDIYRKLQED